MIFLYGFLALTLLILAYMRFEAGFVKVEHVKFTDSSKALKIIQISDIHINLLKVSPSKVRKVIETEKPDLVIITGDYIDRVSHIPAFLDFLNSIKGKHQILLCLGNHDYKAFKGNQKALDGFINSIESTGAVVLHNRSICIEKNSKKYNIIGIGDFRSLRHDISKALENCNDPGATNIAFTHNPDLVLEMPGGSVDYLLCGHFHGGQIWAPFNFEFRVLREDKLCKRGIQRGLHRVNGITVYISRGLGNVCVPLRFLSRPEITVFHMP